VSQSSVNLIGGGHQQLLHPTHQNYNKDLHNQ